MAAAVRSHYEVTEFPCLWDTIESDEQPLARMRVLCGFPVFRNTLTLYWALRAAGADLVATEAPGVPADQQVVSELPGFGIPVAAAPEQDGYDIVMDCAGALSHVPATRGYVELTKSGEDVYRDHPQPVFLVDAGEIKRIETSLGTGDGFVRGLEHTGHADFSGRSVVVFGGGKVGMGVAQRSTDEGAVVTVVDAPGPVADRYRRIGTDDPAAIRDAISSAWCIVSATGVEAALDPFAHDLCVSPALLANMGALDEFGPGVPPDRALNGKEPLNFVLSEPTRLRYIDPSLALAVAGAVELAAGRLHPGLNPPDPALERWVLAPARRHGTIAGELAAIGL